MSNNPKITNFVSEIDQLLQAFDAENPAPSQSQRHEQEKYRRIYFLRNVADRITPVSDLWDNF